MIDYSGHIHKKVLSGCPVAWLLNKKLRIEKIGKIGNFLLKNRRNIRKSIALLSTKIASLYPASRGYIFAI